MKERLYQICTRCILDTTDPDIVFDEQGVCNHCRSVEKSMAMYPYNLGKEEKQKELEKKIAEIKDKGQHRQYDCVIGVSGGVDSTYVAYLTKKLGLRPLAVHLDNGWNSELAVHNIEKICKKIGIDLYTYVLDWEEFRDLQLAFLKASTPDSEIPTDHAIHGVLYKIAAQKNIKYMIIGCNFATESILPPAWSHGHYDWKYIHAIHKKFGTTPLKTFPNLRLLNWFFYKMIKRIQYFTILDYIDYIKEDAIHVLEQELEWQNYGGKHHESVYTKFFQAYILPTKFGFDKRRIHLSSLICAGQMTREEALEKIKEDLYLPLELEEEKRYVIKKLGITEEEFERIMELPPKTFWDYPSYEQSRSYNFANHILRILGVKKN